MKNPPLAYIVEYSFLLVFNILINLYIYKDIFYFDHYILFLFLIIIKNIIDFI